MATSSTGRAKPRSTRKQQAAAVKSKGQEHTRHTVIAAFKFYAEQHDGRAPSSAEWWPARLRQFKAAAEKAGDKKKTREFEAAARRGADPAHRHGAVQLLGEWSEGSWAQAPAEPPVTPERLLDAGLVVLRRVALQA
jgi:hypothetical protein